MAAALAFTAGLLSFLSPCIVPMLSVYFSLITGQSVQSLRGLTVGDAIRQGVLRNTLAFVLGFGLVFTAAGAAAAQVGVWLQESLWLLNFLGGTFVIGLGLVTMGILPQSLIQRLTLRHRDMEKAPEGNRTWSSFLVGLFFAVACSHCIAPTLYSVLVYAGGTGSPVQGGLLMAAFSAGLAVPYLIAGLFLGRVTALLRRSAGPRVWIQRTAGAVLMVLGGLMLAGKLTLLTEAFSRIWPYRLPIGM